jgi:hypothetical protein
MFGQRKGPLYEWLSFSIDHQIIFILGLVVMLFATLYVFINSYFVSIGTFIQARILIIISWFIFFTVLWSEPEETLTALSAILGTGLTLGTCIYVWSEKNNKQ